MNCYVRQKVLNQNWSVSVTLPLWLRLKWGFKILLKTWLMKMCKKDFSLQRGEREQGWLPPWPLWKGTTCTKQFSVLFLWSITSAGPDTVPLFNAGGHFPPRLCSTFILVAGQETSGLLGMVNHVGRDESWVINRSRLWSNTWGNVC